MKDKEAHDRAVLATWRECTAEGALVEVLSRCGKRAGFVHRTSQGPLFVTFSPLKPDLSQKVDRRIADPGFEPEGQFLRWPGAEDDGPFVRVLCRCISHGVPEVVRRADLLVAYDTARRSLKRQKVSLRHAGPRVL